MFDSHMHTPLCKHAVGEPERYAEEAVKQGLRGIIFTCHSPMPRGFMARVRMAMDQFDEYVQMVLRCQAAFAGQLEVRLGMETDWFPGYEEWIAELHGKAPFDYCLGSVHWHGPEYLAAFEQGTREAFRQHYFDHLAESAETGFFDCLAHPDLVKNYRCESWDFEQMRPTIEASLDRIAKTGVHMELNTSGMNKLYAEMNPSVDMLRLMQQRGIPVVIGSDSHKPGRVAEHFVKALSDLKSVGYSQVSVFKQRKAEAIAIDDALRTLTDWSQVAAV
jgi:histidinol-phosphatase (PHP family)